MTVKRLDRDLKYDGTQLSSHFAYRNFGIAGDSTVSFEGPVDVKLSEMVDLEDVRAREAISSDRMLNFIVEIFGMDLAGTVCLQRLLSATAADLINSHLKKLSVTRGGDDLFFEGRKLSVSIATASPVSTLIHFALNIRKTGAPVPVSCLEELGIASGPLADQLLEAFASEYRAILHARVKVNWVR